MTSYEKKIIEINSLQTEVDKIIKNMNLENVNAKLDTCNKLLAKTFRPINISASIKRPIKKFKRGT